MDKDYTMKRFAHRLTTAVALLTLGAAAFAADIIPIGAIQGRAPDGPGAAKFDSPMSGQTVRVQGVIYGLQTNKTRKGASLHGFFVQNTEAQADGDPATSDGVFVFMGSGKTLKDGYAPAPGDEIVIEGTVNEYYHYTQIQSAKLIDIVRRNVVLDEELPPADTLAPSAVAERPAFWERIEGMRAGVPAGAIAVSGVHVYSSTMDGEMSVMHPASPAVETPDVYARRIFRTTHPLGATPTAPILLGSQGVKGSSGDPNAVLASPHTFQTLAEPLVGGVMFSYEKYTVHPSSTPVWAGGADPAKNHPPQAPERAKEFSIASYNVENLYDLVNDPFDLNDAHADPGTGGISKPFNYIPATEEEYRARLKMLARQIVEDLHSPDILMIEEAEDQDLAAPGEDGKLVYGEKNGADGRCDCLQEIIVEIAALGGPEYDTAFDRDGADVRGITCGFMWRTDRVELAYPREDEAVYGAAPGVEYDGQAMAFNAQVQNPKALNSKYSGGDVFARAPQAGEFLVWRDGKKEGEPITVHAIVNHFKSNPSGAVERRREQAAYNARMIDAFERTDPGALIVCGGDLNVFPRPDDPFAPGDAKYPSDQLAALYEQGMINLYDYQLATAPSAAYSYVYSGVAQTLDHLFVNPAFDEMLVGVSVAHINSDWNAESAGDAARGASDHDPVVARFSFE